MSLIEALSENARQTILKAKENKNNGVPHPYNDMAEELKNNLEELGKVFGKKSILLPPKKLRDTKPRDKRSKRQKRIDAKNRR